MSDMKCPFCQQELEYLAEDVYGGMYCPNCKNHDLFGNKKMWQELIDSMKEHDLCHDALVKRTKELDRTQKALAIAVDALDRILKHATAIDTARCRAEIALDQIKQITKQKDEQC